MSMAKTTTAGKHYIVGEIIFRAGAEKRGISKIVSSINYDIRLIDSVLAYTASLANCTKSGNASLTSSAQGIRRRRINSSMASES